MAPKDKKPIKKTAPPKATTSKPLGGERFTRKDPPLHFTLKINKFSVLLETKVETYESGVFEVGGYKWSLWLYPNGNKEKDAEGYISLYLAIEETDNFQPGWEVHVAYKLFVQDQTNDCYLTIQNANGGSSKFHELAKNWGFRRLISLESFKQKSNGYLVRDSCVLGAEVFIMKPTGRSESLTMMKPPSRNKFTWTLDNYSKRDQTSYYSNQFSIGGSTWKLLFYPNGNNEGKDKYISLYLELIDAKKLPTNRKIYVNYKLRVLDQLNDKHHDRAYAVWRSSSSASDGEPKLLPLDDLRKPAKGFLYNDVVKVEVEILVMSETK